MWNNARKEFQNLWFWFFNFIYEQQEEDIFFLNIIIFFFCQQKWITLPSVLYPWAVGWFRGMGYYIRDTHLQLMSLMGGKSFLGKKKRFGFFLKNRIWVFFFWFFGIDHWLDDGGAAGGSKTDWTMRSNWRWGGAFIRPGCLPPVATPHCASPTPSRLRGESVSLFAARLFVARFSARFLSLLITLSLSPSLKTLEENREWEVRKSILKNVSWHV